MPDNSSTTPPKVIHAHVYDPKKSFFKVPANERAELHKIVCKMSHDCEVFERGQCVARRIFGSCIYGHGTRSEGFTRRARKYSEWIANARKSIEGIGTLDSATSKMARIGGHVWLPYAQMAIARSGKVSFGMSERDNFVPIVGFTSDLIVRLCSARPRAMMGGEIKSYQSKSVPLFVSHLSEVFPELLAEAAEKSEHVRGLMGRSKVGRKALLRTLKPNVGTFARQVKTPAVWVWDGETMTCSDKGGFSAFTPFDAVRVQVVPADDAVVVITDDEQITDETVLVD